MGSHGKRRYQPRPRIVLSTPASQTVSLTDAKEYLRVTASNEDNLINRLARSAEALVRQHLSQSLRTETLVAWFDHFPCPENDQWWDGTRDLAISELAGRQDYIDVPWGPFGQVTEFVTIDDSDTEFVFPATSYKVDSNGPKLRVSLAESAVWPSTVLRSNSGIKITFTAGYGADTADVPEPIQQAIYETLAVMYEKRGDNMAGLPPNAYTLLLGYREPKI